MMSSQAGQDPLRRNNPLRVWLLTLVWLLILAACDVTDVPAPSPTTPVVRAPTDTRVLLPDLVIRSVSAVSDSPQDCPAPNQSYHIEIQVENKGGASAGPFVVRMNLDQQLMNVYLEAGKTVSVTFPGYVSNVRAMVDATSLVIERDETNNQIFQTLVLPTPPAECSQATPTPEITLQEASVVLEGHAAKIWDVEFSPDGRTIASGSVDDTLRLWSVEPARLLRTMEGHPFPVLMLAFAPDGSTLYTGSTDGVLRAWDVSTGRQTQSLEGHLGWITGLDVSRDGRWLASSSEDSTVRLWRLPAASSVQIVDEGMAGVSKVAFMPDSSAVAWGEVDGTLRLRTIGGTWLQALNGRATSVTGLAFSPDGERLVAGFSDGFIRVWDASEGVQLQTIYGHSGAISDLVFSPDGQWLVSASIDTSLRLWKFEGGAFTPLPVRIFKGHTGPVTAVDFSPSENLVASSSEDGTIRLWTVP